MYRPYVSLAVLLCLAVLRAAHPLRAQDLQPCTPTVTTAREVTLQWRLPPPQPTGLALTGFGIDRHKEGEPWLWLKNVGPDVTTETDTTLEVGGDVSVGNLQYHARFGGHYPLFPLRDARHAAALCPGRPGPTRHAAAADRPPGLWRQMHDDRVGARRCGDHGPDSTSPAPSPAVERHRRGRREFPGPFQTRGVENPMLPRQAEGLDDVE
jgi:hypothetical protein